MKLHKARQSPSLKMALFVLAALFFAPALAQNPVNYCLKADSVHIVVLGSSTAAGTGPSSNDSAWVNRYRNYLQAINASNQVTNLARGGYTTYHLMPDGNQPPAGRPQPDTTRNVSRALELRPDGIIINLPSNDASTGVSVNTQMSNFIAMQQYADSAGVPVWVCTTQPVNYAVNSPKIQVQLDVRDSILSYFGSKAINFWNGLANAQNRIDSNYNADGVHLNDAGHRILFSRVRNAQLLSQLVDTVRGADLACGGLVWLNQSRCGSAQSELSVEYGNRFFDSIGGPFRVHLKVENEATGSVRNYSRLINNGIPGCASDTAVFLLNTASGGTWNCRAYLSGAADSVPENDTSQTLVISTFGIPKVNSRNDTFCTNQTALLSANGGDTTLWYDARDSLISVGDSLMLPGLQGTDTLFARTAIGPFAHPGSLRAAARHSIDWNGIMFDLHADSTADILLKTVNFYAASAGRLIVEKRIKKGSYKGHESSASAWQLMGRDTLNLAQPGKLYALDFGLRKLKAGDTLGVYLSLQNPAHRLSYLWSTAEDTFNAPGLQLTSGTGISSGFSNTYYPRIFAGNVDYYYGHKSDGQCQSPKVPVVAKLSKPQVNLGSDTVLTVGDSLLLDAGPGFQAYHWYDGSKDRYLSYTASQAGQNNLWVEVTNNNGCRSSDTIAIRASGLSATSASSSQNELQVYPNPARHGELYLRSDNSVIQKVRVLDMQGRPLQLHKLHSTEARINISALKPGTYILRVKTVEKVAFRKLVIP